MIIITTQCKVRSHLHIDHVVEQMELRLTELILRVLDDSVSGQDPQQSEV